MYGKGPGYGAPSGYDPRFQNQVVTLCKMSVVQEILFNLF